ncbi:PR domain zinc finger protein 5 [Pseudolycoriella hygida]|uniref:PR domain zinc finger protein 5 n=1 Tax=Pseudolycoriella hygida TaxID=35572 RepID=A0A9Q0RZS6_9DIPT|nr:PR domain zinc finger protein 5 [Pseudolycoriella hygida]
MNRIKDSRKPQCNVCLNRFKSIVTLKKHMLLHSDRMEFSCEICSKRFRRKEQLHRHLETHFKGHGLSKQDLISIPVNALCLQYTPIIKTKSFACSSCSKVCNSKNHLMSHLISHSNLKPFCCGICSKAFKRRDNLRNHFGVYHREYHQDYSDYMLIEESNIADVGKNFQCDVCSKLFKSKNSVRLHLYTHLDLRPYECKICLKNFQSPPQLKKHLRRHSKQNDVHRTVCTQEVNIDENGFVEIDDIKPFHLMN